MTTKSHQQIRQEVWTKAWCATANATDCKNAKTATSFADQCLVEFDKRFPSPVIVAAISRETEEHKQ